MIYVIEYGWELILIAALLCTYWQEMRHPRDQRWTLMLYGILVSLAAGYGASMFQAVYGEHFTLRIDPLLFRIDEALGCPAYAVGRLLHAHLALGYMLWLLYSLLLIATLCVFAAYVFLIGVHEARALLVVFIMNGALALLVYIAFPASGPAHAFHGFPLVCPKTSDSVMFLPDAPNCLPSVHMSTALLVLWYASRWRIGPVLGGLYVVAIALATLGLGEHYLLDLMLAVPYAAIIIYINSPKGQPHALVLRNPRPEPCLVRSYHPDRGTHLLPSPKAVVRRETDKDAAAEVAAGD